jgi:excisionase family DNA binding protein
MSMKKIDVSGDRLLTRAEVAEIFQVSPSTITRWAEAGKLPSVKTLGGHRRYEAKVVMELVQQLIQYEEVSMDKTTITVPAMYGDHHVIEVRRILLEMPGVEEVNASSCFRVVEVSYDPTKLSVEAIRAKLDQAGYLGELPVPAETATPATQTNGKEKVFFRHTAAYEQTKNVVSFGQKVGYTGRPLWPCPGVGIITAAELQKEETDG